MTRNLPHSILGNPMMVMADLGLRALDMTVSSSMKICDGVDRLGRAAAFDHARMQGTSWRFAPAPSGERAAAAAKPATVTSSERPALDLVMQGWLQWLSTMGTVASLGAGHRLDQSARGQPIPPTAKTAGPRPTPKTQQLQRHRRRAASSADRTLREHALADAEAKRPQRRRARGAR